MGALLPIGEQQSRWFAQLMANKVNLPDQKIMMREIAKKRQEMAKRYYESERHTIQVDWIPYMDELTEQFGAKPNITKLFFTDHKLWRALMFGPCLPYQYRLEGPHQWSGARHAIFNVEERISAPLKTRHVLTNVDNQDNCFVKLFKMIMIIIFSYNSYNYLSK